MTIDELKHKSVLTDNFDSIITYQSIFPNKGKKPYFSYISENAHARYQTAFENNSLEYDKILTHLNKSDLKKLKKLERVALRDMSRIEGEFRFHLEGDQYRWYFVQSTPSKELDGSIVFNGLLLDITEQKKAFCSTKKSLSEELKLKNELLSKQTELNRANQKLVESNKALHKAKEDLDSFLHSLSHDLKAPIASLLGLINVSKIAGSKEEMKLLLDKKEQSIMKMDGFINDILDYTRNNQNGIKKDSIDLESLIEGIFEQYSHLNEAGSILKTTSINGGAFVNDKLRISIILNNIISNAIKYRSFHTPSYIKIHAHIAPEEVSIKISDNGIGIHPRHMDKIFNKFYKASESAKGSGLGLYIVKESLSKIGGTIEIQSVPNEGTEILLVVPNQPL